MIVIVAPNAKSAALSVDLKHPPVLTVKAQYGSYTCEGTKYTSSLEEGKPSPCLDEKIPSLEENDVALVKTLDLITLGGLLRASGNFPEDEAFWQEVSSLKSGNIPEDLEIREKHQGILQWLDENTPLSEDDVDFIDVTEFCLMAFTFIREAILDGFLARRMGRARLYLREKLDEKTFYKDYSSGLLCRKTEGEFVNDMFRDSRVICTYNAKDRSITVSSREPIQGFSCRDACSSFWGGDVWGDNVLAGSPNYRALGEGEYLKVVMRIVEMLSKV
jgi:hypothetical protein